MSTETLTAMLERGRSIVAEKRRAEQEEKTAKETERREAAEKHWQALVRCIRNSLPAAILEATDFGFPRPDDLAGLEDFERWTNQTDRYKLRINLPGCTEITTEFAFWGTEPANDAGKTPRHEWPKAWNHWTREATFNSGTYRVSTHYLDHDFSGQHSAFVAEHKDANTPWTADLAEAMALAEEAYAERNRLLAQAEAEKQESAKRREKTPAPLTTDQKLLAALREFVADMIPEEQ